MAAPIFEAISFCNQQAARKLAAFLRVRALVVEFSRHVLAQISGDEMASVRADMKLAELIDELKSIHLDGISSNYSEIPKSSN